MTEIFFYHLEHARLEQVLPVLLEKTLANNWKATVKTSSQQYADMLNSHLWTYRDDNFLPHALYNDARFAAHKDQQPIWLTWHDDVPNKADILFLVDNAEPPEDLSSFTRTIFIFDGTDEQALHQARDIWGRLKQQQDISLSYWQQNMKGGWEKKAE